MGPNRSGGLGSEPGPASFLCVSQPVSAGSLARCPALQWD